jgi:hypothetical protein
MRLVAIYIGCAYLPEFWLRILGLLIKCLLVLKAQSVGWFFSIPLMRSYQINLKTITGGATVPVM